MTALGLALGLPFGRVQSTGGATPPDPGLTLLQSATLWLDASDMATNAQWLRNKGTGGRALDARVGSVGQAQIINGALKLANIGSQGTSTVDSAAIRPTGDVEIVARVSLLDWTPAANQTILSCGGVTTATMNYRLSVHTSGALLFERYASGGGGGNRYAYSVGVASSTDGTAIWVKATCDIDNGAGGTDFKFYTAADQTTEPSSWTQLGTTVTTATDGTGVGNSNTSGLFIGRLSSGNSPMAGSVFRAIVRNGIGGTTVFDADFTAQSTLATSFTESSSNAATVTINSTTGVDTNDPLLLPHTGTNYLYLPGIAGNNCTVPNSTALNVTGSIDIRARVALADWTPSATQTIVSKRNNSGTNFSYEFRVNAAGTLLFAWGSDASTYNEETSSAAPTVSDGQAIWLRVTRDTSTGDVIFYQAADSPSMPSSWTQIGTTQASTPSAIYGSTNNLNLGAFYHTTPNFGSLAGNLYRVLIYDGIAGTIVFDADFSTNTGQSTFTESSSNAATVSINRATSGRKAVMVVRPTLLFGTDDYLEVADNDLLDFALADSFTVLCVARQHGTKTSGEKIISKRQASVPLGYDLYATNVRTCAFRISHAGPVNSTDVSETSVTDGFRALLSAVRDTVADTQTARNGSEAGTPTTDSTTLSIKSGVVFRVGTESDSLTIPFAGEIDQVAVFRSALTSTELGQIATYLGV